MLTTALNQFNQDVARARAIVAHADPLPRTNAAEQMLRSDLLRSAWMFAVGAMDAYFCDAYGSSGPGGPRGLLPWGSHGSVRALSGIRLFIS